jgi:adenosylmethionine-8-amino-7-oxononanoate aminotransferase
MALKYWDNKGMPNKKKILSFDKAYHGSTFIAASADTMYQDYGWDRLALKPNMFPKVPFPSGLYFDAKNVKSGETVGQAAARIFEETVQSEGPENIAAFLFEPIQGDAGINIPHDDYFAKVRDLCTQHKILMIADEVMTFGKTGKWFAMQHWNVHPDIITVAKGISNGYLPLGVVILTEDIHQVVMNAGT